MKPPDLVLLTATFPFGNKSETFLETEIEVLAERFDRIFVLPSARERIVRPLPEGVTLVEMHWLDEGPRAPRRALLDPRALAVLTDLVRRTGDWGPYLRHARTYLDILARNVAKSRQLDVFIRENGLERAIFYDYWFENSTLALALLRRAGTVRTAVSRAHGFDVYDDRWQSGRVPFRPFKADALDAVYSVSEAGAAYLRRRYPPLSRKVSVSRLGVREQPDPVNGPEETPLVLTCGSLIPLKRFHLVPQVLARLNRPVRWIHLGDGPERGTVEAAAAELPARVVWELRGHVDNARVIDFYREQHVDALLSLSVSEGLPVSMMEALSFGVPIVAVAAGGVPEIAVEVAGVCMPLDAGLDDIAAALTEALAPGRFDAAAIRSFFLANFHAHTNYGAFADALIHAGEA